MNILIITAHPSKMGFTHQIANAYTESSTQKGHKVEIIDLYNSPRQEFLSFDNESSVKTEAQNEIQKMYQDKVTISDEIVFIHPLWWGSMPAIMKNWLDVNFSGGFSHTYKDGKAIPLLTGKTARVFITSDAPSFVYWILARPFAVTWRLITLRFVGIKCKTVTLYGNKRKRSEDDDKAFLEKVKNMVE
jgi:NAD(P)H dehydrogenase (quinone)